MTISATQRAQQEQQIAQFLKFSLVGSAVVHLVALALAMPFIHLTSDGTDEPIAFMVLETSTPLAEEAAEPEAVEPTPIASPVPEPMPEEIKPEAIAASESVESATLEPLQEPTPEPDAVNPIPPEPQIEPDSLDGWEETPVAVPEAMESPTSPLLAEPLPRQRPLEPYANPAPLTPEEVDPMTPASSPLDPGHSSRIANSQDIPGNQRGRDPATLGRLPDPPDLRQFSRTEGPPSELGAIASDELDVSDDPFSSNLDRLSDPFEGIEGTEPNPPHLSSGLEVDGIVGMTPGRENPSEEGISCLRCDRPQLPQMARETQGGQTVIILADIAPSGTVIWADIEQSSGDDTLDEAALNQILTWTFDPSAEGQIGRIISVTFEQ
jgi:TonB family protein